MSKYFFRFSDPDRVRYAMSTPRLWTRPLHHAYSSARIPHVLIADCNPDDAQRLRGEGAAVYQDIEFDIVAGRQPREYWFTSGQPAPAILDTTSLKDVLNQIKAPEAWQASRGQGVTIAILDTGVCDSLLEIPPAKRSTFDAPTVFSGLHWSDGQGHGSMCSVIAAGTRAAGGKYDGVAPDATVLSVRSILQASDLYLAMDRLIEARRSGDIPTPLVISNSYGIYTCSAPPELPEDHPYHEIILMAIREGISMVFAAGNNHFTEQCNLDPVACGPTTIWGVNSLDAILSIGTVNANNSNRDSTSPHCNSSRGPGQFARRFFKPDCVAPTYGEVVWGCSYRWMPWWGTSGAAPQVAGLVALILAVRPNLSPAAINNIIRNTCRPLDAPANCVGHGLIDCQAAVALAMQT